jgi:hypothetical protein
MDISIYQICYEDDQHRKVDPLFSLYDNSSHNRPSGKMHNEREYRVFLDAYESKKHLLSECTGFLSWKFQAKTKLTGRMLIDKILETPESDVYFVNCGPVNTSVWHHGERKHPGLIKFTQTILNRLNIDIDLQQLIHTKLACCFCNYWVGTPEFWDQYMNFTRPIYDHIRHELSYSEVLFLRSRADRGISSDYFPFIMERLFTTLLAVDSSISYTNIPKIK